MRKNEYACKRRNTENDQRCERTDMTVKCKVFVTQHFIGIRTVFR